ncbi:TPA: hypothetical protein HA338_17155 [Methanosarcina acetivorans]|uniref:DUF11 domain-containing protein n=2 Tax=Methanosarcina acetivorans TaxID=2214 RepID=Q8TLE5_METAC|nr:hypothetical protein [Methanosarcina acetivorans]AAM06464.1 predicted protein [Methanosarcina acetivorans C2A]HIH95656.1 hypothetical protein [Methanosarcina acetivorans]
MSYCIPKVASALPVLIFVAVLLAQSVSAYETHAPADTVKDSGADDVEWVEFGSGEVAWKTTTEFVQYSGTRLEVQVLNESGEYETVPYVLKVNDFNFGRTMADISIAQAEEGAKPVHKILFLDGTGEYENWCQIDHELKIELTDITEDSQSTPYAKLKYYKRGNPEMEIEIKSSTETYDGVSVGEADYFPERKKEIVVKVKNSGDAWIERIKLDVNLTNFDLADSRKNLSERDIQSKGDHLYADLGWLAKGEERSINFTVRAPSWEEINSHLEMEPCNITAIATGDDILGYEYEGNKTHSFSSPDPDINVVRKLYTYSFTLEDVAQVNEEESKSDSTEKTVHFSEDKEIFMSSWYIKDSEVRGLKGYCVLREALYNLQGYPLENLSFVLPPVPEGLLIAEAYRNGKPARISGDKPSSMGRVSFHIPEDTDSVTLVDILPDSIPGKESYNVYYILVPTRPGTYKIEGLSVSAECYGYNLSEKSEAISLTVHGPRIVVTKSMKTDGEDKVDVAVTVKNDGDRVASASLTDRVPMEAGLVRDSVSLWRKETLQDSPLSLKEYKLEVDDENKSTSVLTTFPLQPGESYDLKYSLRPENLSNMDLPYAEVDFKDRNNYKGTVFSSFFKSGAEVTQEWNYYENSWEVTSENWDASAENWEEYWDPIAKRWASEIEPEPVGTLEDYPAELPEAPKSTLDKIKDFLTGILSDGDENSESADFIEETEDISEHEPLIIKIRNFVTGLLPSGGKDTGTDAEGETQ